MKNKKITIILSLIIILGMTVPVFATQSITETGTTTVSYGVSEGYTVSIPADFTVTTTATVKEISASNVLLEDGETLKVTMKSTNGYKLKNGTSEIAYSIKNGETALTGEDVEVLSVAAGTTSGKTELTFSTTTENINAATLSGTHTDTLTFTVGK